jgi:protein-S-isoprenylcysteine O-methyltransferase Ste14
MGETFLSCSLVLLLWSVFFFTGNILYFLLWEEPGLERRFGDEYRAYKKQVPMFIPFIRRGKP